MGAHLPFEVCLLECAGQRTATTNVVNSGEEFVDEKVFKTDCFFESTNTFTYFQCRSRL